MPTIPYQQDGDERRERLAAEIRARRGGRLLNLDRMLLHSPPFAEGWQAFMPRVRNDLSLPVRHRELIICAVARLNDAAYEFHHHAPLLAGAGAPQAQIDALDDVGTASRNEALFPPAERAILRFTLESTRHVRVGEGALQALRQAFPDPRHVLEIVGVCAAYNMVSRVLVALGVEIEEA